MVEDERTEVVLGPRVTVFTLLRAYPFLREFLVAYDGHFAPLRREGGGWARVAALGQAAAAMGKSWVQLAGDIAAEIERVTGSAPEVSDRRPPASGDEERLVAARSLAVELERGGSLLELSHRLAALTRDLDPERAAVLDRELGGTAACESSSELAGAIGDGGATDADPTAGCPPGHPLETLVREGRQVRRLVDELRGVLSRLGGAPSRRRWRAARPQVVRLVPTLSGIDLRFRRHQQAWFPALAVLGVEGPAVLLGEREAQALETIRRLRLAVDGDDGATVVEAGLQLVAQLDDILRIEDEVLAPLARRRFASGDWAAVRELEEGVGWSLIPPPPPWPAPS